MTPAQALVLARERGVDRLDAQALLERASGRSRAWLIAHDDHALDETTVTRFAADLAQRAAGVPPAYLVGTKEFFGLDFEVNAAVLVPRPETETLVEWAIECLVPNAAVLDLGAGSGAIAVALAHRRRDARVVATDTSAGALDVAQRNAARHGVTIEWRLGSWWQAIGDDERFDLIVSNPPYVAEGDPHLQALRAEPQVALVAGPDGLNALRAIVAGAPAHLRRGGWLLLEHGFEQADAVAALLERHGFGSVETRRDLAGLPRCTGGRRD